MSKTAAAAGRVLSTSEIDVFVAFVVVSCVLCRVHVGDRC